MSSFQEEFKAFWDSLDPFHILDPKATPPSLPQSIRTAIAPLADVEAAEPAIESALEFHESLHEHGGLDAGDLSNIVIVGGLRLGVQLALNSLIDREERRQRGVFVKFALMEAICKGEHTKSRFERIAFDLAVISLSRSIAWLDRTEYRHKWTSAAAGVKHLLIHGGGLQGLLDGSSKSDERRFTRTLPGAANLMPLAFAMNLYHPLQCADRQTCTALIERYTAQSCFRYSQMEAPDGHPLAGHHMAWFIANWNEFAAHLDKTYTGTLVSEHHRENFAKAAESLSWDLWMYE